MVPLEDLLNKENGTATPQVSQHSIENDRKVVPSASKGDGLPSPNLSKRASDCSKRSRNTCATEAIGSKGQEEEQMSPSSTSSSSLPYHSSSHLNTPPYDLLGASAASPTTPSSSDSSSSSPLTQGHNPADDDEDDMDNDGDSEDIVLYCKWENCGMMFNQPELLYSHLCHDHVGRKSHKNLQLNCHWGDCSTKTEKRDHITSHLRVHVPLKPFGCSTCSKKFKRPQDLKKHLKIHLENGGILKRKRGPKLGSKRTSKKNKRNVKDAVSSRPASLPYLVNGSFKSHSTSPQILPPLPTGMPQRLPSQQQQQQQPQPISLNQLCSDEISQYKPFYSPQLSARLQTILPPLYYNNGKAVSQGGNSQMMPVYEDGCSNKTIAGATQFFTKLSRNMTNNYILQQSGSGAASSASSAHIPIAQTSYVQPPTAMPYQSLQAGGSASPTTNTTSYVPIQLAKYPEGSSVTEHLPPLHSSTTGSVLNRQSQHVMPPYQPAHAVPNYSSAGCSILPPLQSKIPMLPSRRTMMGETPLKPNWEFSLNQKSCTNDIIMSKLANDEIEDESDVEDDFVEMLGIVNIIKDYLLCRVMEDDESEDEDEEVTFLQESLGKLGLQNRMGTNSARILTKYPRILV
ncbi:Rim101p [Saccharomyces cerevisiae x Saccharomyces kudriavzevii VIN7]|uniref:pH-response transcription factor pacC/RIM101 n=1 Tax=Saccharomyces cerevisiae x Saccharomyces kudriavzevii (strain VIN7) TaxID=1095631 RepID=H0GVJ3_SACCK|nr:Rim101p [Saccharomyces cerevisiae x Saccharomyces kudriavzevii VIN7]